MPAPDLGTRTAFDRAQAMVWAADGNSIYYLSVPDSQDPTGAVGIRQARLSDSSVSELAVLAQANRLLSGSSGDLYVGTAYAGNPNKFFRLSPGPGGSATLQALPFNDPEGAQGHVTERGVLDHASDGCDFLGGELGRGGVRVTRPIVEGAGVGEFAPGMEAGGREAEDAHGNGQRDRLLGGSDGRQDRTLGLTVGHPLRVEAEAREANEEEGKADGGEEESDAPPEGEDLGLKLGMVQGERRDGKHRTRTAADPADGRGTWDTEVMEEAGVALLADEVAHSVVIGSTAGSGMHGAWSTWPGEEASLVDGDFLPDFARVAFACARVQKVLVRSWAQ